jgi:hypothetical protein
MTKYPIVLDYSPTWVQGRYFGNIFDRIQDLYHTAFYWQFPIFSFIGSLLWHQIDSFASILSHAEVSNHAKLSLSWKITPHMHVISIIHFTLQGLDKTNKTQNFYPNCLLENRVRLYTILQKVAQPYIIANFQRISCRACIFIKYI